MGDVLLRGATLADATTVDVRLRGGSIVAVVAPGALAVDRANGADGVDDVAEVDLRGYLLLPAAVEPHTHLDKAFLSERLVNPTGDLRGAIETMIASRPSLTVEDTIERGARAALLLAANGCRAVRTHADTTLDHGLRSVEALVEVRRRVADVVDVEVVAMSGWPVAGADGEPQRRLLRDALALGADLLGGCPHLDAATRPATETYLEIAAEHRVGVDLHTDETLDAGVDGLSDLAAVVAATGFPHPVTASHCVSLGVQPVARQREVAEAVAGAGIAVVALPATNLYLQGRDQQAAMPRGLTAVKALQAAGVVVAAGCDNLQDPFNPVGRADPFDTASLMVLTAHLQPEDAWACVGANAALATGRAPTTIAAGQPADLIAVPGASLREAMAFAAVGRRVWRRGVELGPELRAALRPTPAASAAARQPLP
jgi:cytosine deaminase